MFQQFSMFHAIWILADSTNTTRHPSINQSKLSFPASKHCLACIMKLRQAKNQVFTTIWGQLIFDKTAGHNTQCQGFWLEIFRLRTAKQLCTWAAAAERVPGQPQLRAICGIALCTKRTNPRNLNNTMPYENRNLIFYVKNFDIFKLLQLIHLPSHQCCTINGSSLNTATATFSCETPALAWQSLTYMNQWKNKNNMWLKLSLKPWWKMTRV